MSRPISGLNSHSGSPRVTICSSLRLWAFLTWCRSNCVGLHLCPSIGKAKNKWLPWGGDQPGNLRIWLARLKTTLSILWFLGILPIWSRYKASGVNELQEIFIQTLPKQQKSCHFFLVHKKTCVCVAQKSVQCLILPQPPPLYFSWHWTWSSQIG